MKKFITQKLIVITLLVFANFNTKADAFSGCSVGGTASATIDSICVNGTTTLLLTGYVGNIQWQSFDGTTWQNETGPGATTDAYTVTLTTSTDFRAVVTELACPADTSNVHSINVGVVAPVTQGATRCGYGPVTLNALGGGIFKWYDSPSSTTPLYTGSSFTTTVGSTTTYYCASATSSGGSGVTPMPAQTGTFSSNARGYFFISPIDFTITGVFVPGSNGPTQNIAVVRFDPPIPPPAYATTTNDFVLLFLTQNNPATGVIPVNIQVSAGDVIGVLGTRGPNDVNSYAPSPNTTIIDGNVVAITRMGMQFPLATTAPQQLWQEAGGSVSRVELTYDIGCESSRTPTDAIVNAPPPMTITANPPALCEGQSSTLTAVSSNPGYTYTWSPATGLSSTTGGSVTATPLAPITYTLIGDDGTCGNIDSISIAVGPASVAGAAVISTDTICLGSDATLFLSGYTGGIQWQSYNGTSWVNETGIGSTSDQYLVTPTSYTEYRAIVTSGGCDPDTSVTLSIEVLAVVDPTTVNDTLCGPGTANLLSSGVGTLNWYNTPTGGASIFTGTNYTPNVSTTTTYYVEASAGGSYNVGAVNSGIGTQFALAGNDWGMQFDVIQQVTLDRVYVSPGGTSGNIKINLRSVQNGTIINTVTKAVTAFSGLQPVDLGWSITPGTGYRLEMDATSVPCYYNSFGASYPYTFPGSSVSITGYVNPNFASGTFYYFFYNWQITEGCSSNRVPVTCVVLPAPPIPMIAQNGTLLTSSIPNNIQWYMNGVAIPGETNATYDIIQSGTGTYTVIYTDPSTGCSIESLPIIYTGLNENLTAAGIFVYPNPVQDQFTVEFKNSNGNGATISLYDKLGKLITKTVSHENKVVIPANVTPGSYSVEIQTGNGVYTTKVLKL